MTSYVEDDVSNVPFVGLDVDDVAPFDEYEVVVVNCASCAALRPLVLPVEFGVTVEETALPLASYCVADACGHALVELITHDEVASFAGTEVTLDPA